MEEVKQGRKISNELINKIKQAHKDGDTSRIIAEKCGISKTTVLEYVSIKKKRNPLDVEEKRKRNVEAVKRRRKKVKEMAVEYKGGKCEKCGYNKCTRALEFHHLDPAEKDFGIAHKGRTNSWEKIKIELDKCIMVCANCHAEIHDEINNNPQ